VVVGIMVSFHVVEFPTLVTCCLLGFSCYVFCRLHRWLKLPSVGWGSVCSFVGFSVNL